MTGALTVKGFNEISYDELMDVNGGGSFYIEGYVDDSRNWGVEAGYRTDGGTKIYARFDSQAGFTAGISKSY